MKLIITIILCFLLISCTTREFNNPVDPESQAYNSLPVKIVQHEPEINGDSIIISWSPSTDPNFSYYKVYRSNSSVIDTGTGIIGIYEDINDTIHIDFGISEADTTYYCIYTSNIAGNITPGTKKFVTNYNIEPPPERPEG